MQVSIMRFYKYVDLVLIHLIRKLIKWKRYNKSTDVFYKLSKINFVIVKNIFWEGAEAFGPSQFEITFYNNPIFTNLTPFSSDPC